MDFVSDIGIIFGVNFDTFNNLFTAENPLDDVYVDYTIPGVGSFHLKILENDQLLQGVAFFRPIIRGWLVFLMVIFTWNNMLGLIRQAMPIAPSSPTETESISISESKSEKMGNGWTRTTTKTSRRSDRK